MDSKLADALIPLAFKLIRFGQYITRLAEDWHISLMKKYKRY